MEKYLNKLLEQFMSAKGITHADVSSKEFIKDFCSWLKEYKLASEKYLCLVECVNDGHTYDMNSVEIGKGLYDSLALDKTTTIMTPYSDGLEDKTESKIITGVFSARGFGHGPVVLTNGRLSLVDDNIKRYVTHNPYTQSDIRNWERLQISGKDITVGVFGSVYDKNIEEKIKQMKELKNRLVSGYATEEYGTIDYMYYYFLNSNNKKLTLNK